MVKDKHEEYHVEDLAEGKVRMVDPHVSDNKDSFSDKEELGVNPDITHQGHVWQVDTFKGRMGQHKTPQLKEFIKEIIREVLNERE